MAFGGSFVQFAGRVLAAAKKGALSLQEMKKLENLLTRTGKRNTILAKGILSALSTSNISQRDIKRFGGLLVSAEERIHNNKRPFTGSEQRELNEIFKRAYISAKTAHWFSSQLDELVAEEINEFISGARGIEAAVPLRKSVRFERKDQIDYEERENRRKLKV